LKSWLNLFKLFENKTSGWSSPFDNFAYRYVLFLEKKPKNSNTISLLWKARASRYQISDAKRLRDPRTGTIYFVLSGKSDWKMKTTPTSRPTEPVPSRCFQYEFHSFGSLVVSNVLLGYGPSRHKMFQQEERVELQEYQPVPFHALSDILSSNNLETSRSTGGWICCLITGFRVEIHTLISEVFCPLLFFKFFLEKIMGTHFDF
jgi:hypothetical protein